MSSWNDSLLIGVKHVDEQHQELVNKMDRLVEACNQGKGQDEVGETLKYIVSYIQTHFKDEEELQALYAYPDMDAHIELHSGFVTRTVDLMHELRSGQCADFADKVRRMLLGWFLQHINIEDRKVGAYIKKATDR